MKWQCVLVATFTLTGMMCSVSCELKSPSFWYSIVNRMCSSQNAARINGTGLHIM
jgi:hypothetical protein